MDLSRDRIDKRTMIRWIFTYVSNAKKFVKLSE